MRRRGHAGDKIEFVMLLTLLVLACIAPATVAAQGSAVALDRDEQMLWNEVAAARVKAGLPTLALNTEATTLARTRTDDMANRAYFSHVSPDGKSVSDLLPAHNLHWRSVSETIAVYWDTPDSGAEAARGFIASPAHYAVLFDTQFTAAGVGHGVDRSGNHYFAIVIFTP